MTNRFHIGIGMTAALLALAVASLSGCRKQEPADPVTSVLSFSAQVSPETRTYIAGTSLVEASTGNHLPIFATGTFYGPGGSARELFTGQQFAYDGSDAQYHATPNPAYWPVGGTADFLTYAGPAASAPASNPTVTWPGVHGADQARFAFTDTKAADIDLVWAVANDQGNQATPVDLEFSHALARLVLEVKDEEDTDAKLRLVSVELRTGTEKLCLEGTFTVDNTLTVPFSAWTGLAATSDWYFFHGKNIRFSADGVTNLVGNLDGTDKAKIGEYVRLVEMYVPEQLSKNIIVTYKIGASEDEFTSEFNLARRSWKMGSTYVYQLTFNIDHSTITVKCDVLDPWMEGGSGSVVF